MTISRMNLLRDACDWYRKNPDIIETIIKGYRSTGCDSYPIKRLGESVFWRYYVHTCKRKYIPTWSKIDCLFEGDYVSIGKIVAKQYNCERIFQ